MSAVTARRINPLGDDNGRMLPLLLESPSMPFTSVLQTKKTVMTNDGSQKRPTIR
jgi:hypothetical protein